MTCQMPMLFHLGWLLLCAPELRIVRKIRTAVLCWFWGISRGHGVVLAGPIFVRTRKRGSVKLGDNVRFNSTIKENALCRGPSVLDTRLGGIITIGSNSGLSSAVLSCKSSISVGERVLIGANTQIYDHNFHALKPEDRQDARRSANIKTAPVAIGNDCFIGANCMILKGTRIGSGSIVAAGSVVFGLDVPPNSLVRGNPASVVGGVT